LSLNSKKNVQNNFVFPRGLVGPRRAAELLCIATSASQRVFGEMEKGTFVLEPVNLETRADSQRGLFSLFQGRTRNGGVRSSTPVVTIGDTNTCTPVPGEKKSSLGLNRRARVSPKVLRDHVSLQSHRCGLWRGTASHKPPAHTMAARKERDKGEETGLSIFPTPPHARPRPP
jgi:hypothetical protein